MRVKEFMELYSDSNFHFMTSKGYLFLNSDQVKSILLEGQKEAAKKELGKGIRADELLAGEVISVSWKNAQEFIGRLNAMTGKTFRLPTEAEWEYAARGGHKSKHYKYSGSNQVSEVAWYVGNSSGGQYGEAGTTRPVGLKKSNELGLYDMSGNVWEWCGDLYTKEYKQGGKSIHPGWPFEGTYLFFRRILRGGSWGGTAKGCRVSYIDYDIENYSDEYGGFRLVMEPESIK